MTTHEFVFCWGEPKIHDLSFFKGSESAILSKDEVLAGIDIWVQASLFIYKFYWS